MGETSHRTMLSLGSVLSSSHFNNTPIEPTWKYELSIKICGNESTDCHVISSNLKLCPRVRVETLPALIRRRLIPPIRIAHCPRENRMTRPQAGNVNLSPPLGLRSMPHRWHPSWIRPFQLQQTLNQSSMSPCWRIGSPLLL